METLWIIGGVAAIGIVWLMLSRLTARGGEKSGDASRIVGSSADQAAAFHGDDPEHREAWDGVRRPDTDPVGFG